MLLRSSSTPVLWSMIPSVSHRDGGNSGDCEAGASLHADGGKRFYLHPVYPCFQSFSTFTSPISRHMTADCNDAGLVDGSNQDFDGEVVSRSNFKRAQSDTDLHSLGRSSSAPVKASAESLLQGVDPAYDDFHVSSSQRQWSRRIMAPTRLQSIPQLPFHSSGNESEGNEDLGEIASASNLNTLIGEENKWTDSFDNLELSKSSTERDFGFQMDRPLDTRELQSITGLQEERELLKPIKNHIALHEVSDAVKNAAPKEDFKAVSEARPSEVSKPGVGALSSYGVGIGLNGVALLSKSGAYGEEPPLSFTAHGLGMDATNPLTAVGDGGGGKSFRKLSTGQGGDGFGADSNNIEAYYHRMLEDHPCNPLLLGNYAQFLYEIKHDYDKAEEYYSRAILAEPCDGEVLSRYAKLIWELHRDENRASNYFEQAVQVSPEDCNVIAAYASFLWDCEKDEQEPEQENSSSANVPSLYGVLTSTKA